MGYTGSDDWTTPEKAFNAAFAELPEKHLWCPTQYVHHFGTNSEGQMIGVGADGFLYTINIMTAERPRGTWLYHVVEEFYGPSILPGVNHDAVVRARWAPRMKPCPSTAAARFRRDLGFVGELLRVHGTQGEV